MEQQNKNNDKNKVNSKTQEIKIKFPQANNKNHSIDNKDQIKTLETKLKEANERVEKYQKRINEMDNESKQIAEYYKIELVKKSKLAQDEINKKVEEVTNKLNAELKNAKKYAIEDQAVSLIDIISQFENAIAMEVSDPAVKNYLSGFKMFLNMFQNLLSDMGIKEIMIKIGDQFDEKIMEAVSVSHQKELKKNSVSKVIKKGYKLHDKVIQFVQVEVNE